MDFTILHWIQDYIANDFLDCLMVFITHLGDHGAIWILLAFGLIIFSKKYRPWGFGILIALLLGHIVGNMVLKPLVQRPRPFCFEPEIVLLISPPGDFSFPSGHTLSSFVAATMLFYMKRKWGIYAYGLAVLIGFSRLYLYVHFPSDVLSGAVLGILLAVLVASFYLRLYPKKE